MTMHVDSAARNLRATYLVTCLLACGLPLHALAGDTVTIATPVYLGDWLADRLNAEAASPAVQAGGAPYTAGLVWQSNKEVTGQELLRRRLLDDIGAMDGGDPKQRARRDGMVALISSRPATGRVPVKSGDARWLQAHRANDPLLERGDKVTVPTRPMTVTVIRADGTLCPQPHVPNAEALHYVRVCDPEASPEFAWVVQPDGFVARYGAGLWNRSAQDLPAPGAWIWAPDRGVWPQDISERIAAFFATQGVPAVDAPGPAPAMPTSEAQAKSGAADRSRDLPLTGNDWGVTGLLQTPTARMAEAGEASVSLSHVTPYTRLNVMLQPLDWLELGFRYTDISNQLYGPQSLSGTQTYKHKSVDAKFRLLKESAFLPELSVGFRDFGGTSLFAGEYLVGSKRTGDFDWSLGLGWGYVGARGNLRNPLSALSHRFDVRGGSDGAGTFSPRSYFRGRTSVFGGVQYHTPWDRLILKLEYDGNDYKHEPFGMTLRDRSPINVGAVYRASPHVDLTVGYERGNRVMFGIAIHGNLKNAGMPKIGDPPPLPVSVPLADAAWRASSGGTPNAPALPAPAADPDWARLAADLQAQTGWRVTGVRHMGAELFVEFDNPDAFYLQDHIERAANVLNRDAPSDIRTFHLLPMQWGLPVANYTIKRAVWVDNHARAVPPSEKASAVVSEPPLPTQAVEHLPQVFEQAPERFRISVGPGYQQTLGGPNGFLLYQLSANALAELRLARHTWLGGDLNIGLIDNYNKFTYTAPSALPRVRTFQREYVTTSRVTIPFLQLTNVGSLGRSQYYSVYGGLLESMFAGVGAEWLYRPWDSRVAVGVDVNAVRQRGFRQDLALRDYRTATGHLTVYWDTGWNGVQANISVGRYLAKDRGVTLDVSRTFQNGVTIGAFATRTNVSSATFGEGSFDKGIYVTIPFDAMMTRSSGSAARLNWNPLTRDGGAKLNRQYPLYDLTRLGDPRSLWYGPPASGR